jgi:predicted nucleic acid-binding protein
MVRPTILADTSIWIDHIAGKPTPLADLLKFRRVSLHPLIIGEIAMGSLRNRKHLINELQKLPKVHVASNAEVMAMVEWLRLFSTGIGFVDAHLLAGVKMTDKATILTKDGRLRVQAERLGVAYAP